jgi:hypothetical protein
LGITWASDLGKLKQEIILVLTPVGNGSNEYLRVGIAEHEHEIMRVFDGSRDKMFEMMGEKHPKVPLLRHFALTCSAAAEEKIVDLV